MSDTLTKADVMEMFNPRCDDEQHGKTCREVQPNEPGYWCGGCAVRALVESRAELARRYRVGFVTMPKAVTGRTWRHLSEAQ